MKNLIRPATIVLMQLNFWSALACVLLYVSSMVYFMRNTFVGTIPLLAINKAWFLVFGKSSRTQPLSWQSFIWTRLINRLTIMSSSSCLPSLFMCFLSCSPWEESCDMNCWIMWFILRCTTPIFSESILQRVDFPDLGRPKTKTRGFMVTSKGIGRTS